MTCCRVRSHERQFCWNTSLELSFTSTDRRQRPSNLKHTSSHPYKVKMKLVATVLFFSYFMYFGVKGIMEEEENLNLLIGWLDGGWSEWELAVGCKKEMGLNWTDWRNPAYVTKEKSHRKVQLWHFDDKNYNIKTIRSLKCIKMFLLNVKDFTKFISGHIQRPLRKNHTIIY